MNDVKEAKVFFWPYDVFGYLLPGCIVTLAVLWLDPSVRAGLTNKVDTTHWANFALFVFVSYVFGHVLAAASSWTVERLWIGRTGHTPYDILLSQKNQPAKCKSWRFINYLLPKFPVPLDAKNRQMLHELYNSMLGLNGNHQPKSSDIFWHANGYLMHNSPAIYQHILHFVELYGLYRNSAMAFAILAFLSVCRSWDIAGIVSVHDNWILTLIFAVSAALLFFNYCKFFARHSENVLSYFAMLASVKTASNVEK